MRSAARHKQRGRYTIEKAQGQTLQVFYRTQVGLVYRSVYQSVRNHQEAEDLASEIFLKVVSGMDTTRGAKTAKRWLIELTRTTLADYWRARARVTICSLEALVDTGWEGPLEEPPSRGNTAVDRVQRLLQALPTPYREILTRRFLLQLSIRDTALSLGLTVANVKVVQHCALKRAADLAPVLLSEHGNGTASVKEPE